MQWALEGTHALNGVTNYFGAFRSLFREMRLRRVRAWLRLTRIRVRNKFSILAAFVAKRAALVWAGFYRVQYQAARWRRLHGVRAIIFITLMMIVFSAFALPVFDGLFRRYVTEAAGFELVRSVLLTLGGALFGASAIVSSLVLFAMQVNIERLPHTLFRRFGNDALLLSAFAATFILSLGVLALTLVPMPLHGALACYSSIWATIIVLLLFLFSYRRSLDLVNPSKQLGAVVSRCRRDIRMWARRVERARPLWTASEAVQHPSFSFEGKEPDLQKAAYLRLNSHWTNEAAKGVAYAVAFARRYAEQGDYEVSGRALNSLGVIVQDYVAAKKGSFFSQHFLIENPFSTDGFINGTLEHLRQISGAAIAKSDEQLTEQVMSLLSNLVHVFCGIEYGRTGDPKTHAHLAAAYLSGAVEKVVPLQMTDVLMHGLRMMGQSGLILIATEGPNAATTLTNMIGTISAVGAVSKELRPVTTTGVQELSSISYNLLLRKNAHIQFAARDIRGTVQLLAEFIISTPDAGIMGTHSSLLAPYYSSTSSGALGPKLLTLVQSLREQPEDNEEARTIIENLAEWSDQIYSEERPLFKLALERRSKFAFDHFHWMVNVTKALLAASTAPACSEYTRDKLQENATWLISTISWIPDDRDVVAFIEHYQVTDIIFDLSLISKRLGCFGVADKIDGLLLSWGLKAGVYHTGWQTLEDSLCGLAGSKISANGIESEFDLTLELRKRIASGAIGDTQTRREASSELRERASNLGRLGRHHSRIFSVMENVDAAPLQHLIEEMAEILDPITNP